MLLGDDINASRLSDSIGSTGHKDLPIQLYMLETVAKNGFKFDTVQMPIRSDSG
jgi:hypothetical protein